MWRLAWLTLGHGLMMPEEAGDQTRVFMSTASSAVWGNEARDVQGPVMSRKKPPFGEHHILIYLYIV